MNKSPIVLILVALLVAAAYFLGVQTTKVQFLEKSGKSTETLGAKNPQPSKPQPLKIAQNIGIDKNKFKSCLESGKYAKQVQTDLEDGKQAGVRGTPATFVNGQVLSGAQPFSAFKAIIDEELKNPNGPLVTGERINVSPGNLAVLGKSDAPVTIIMFADFQCPFCEKLYKDAEKKIIDEYVKPGQAKLIFRNYAFLGPESQITAEGAYCANEQGKFWEYHNFLFDHQGPENSGTFSKENL